jgi:hypothetical protein
VPTHFMNTKMIMVKLKSGDPSDLHLNEKSFGVDLQHRIAALGGKCIATWADETLTLFIQGIENSALDQLLGLFIEAARRHQRRLEVVQVEQELPAGRELPYAYSGPASIRREKLTKKLIFQLPPGVFIASNTYPNGRSAFAEKLEASDTRPAAWKRAVSAGAAHRLCQVLWTQEEFSKSAFPSPGLAP